MNNAFEAGSMVSSQLLQDVETGLPLHRREKLEQVFKIIDKVRAAATVCQCTTPQAFWRPPQPWCRVGLRAAAGRAQRVS